uniref:Uncharacterized protein n=1 Tax=Ascaris lumbricoides TaxID=6252 RepID=A0A0M3ICC4_ASCLU
MDDGQAGPSAIKRKCPPDDFVDDDNDMNRESQYEKRNGTANAYTHERILKFTNINNQILTQMEEEIRRVKDENNDQSGEIQFLKFKIQNMDKEKAHLQSQLLEIRKTFEQRLDEERNRHERLEKELRDEITYQEQERRSNEFRERLSNATAHSTDQQSQAIMIPSSSSDEVSAGVLQTRKVMLCSRRSGVPFPRSLNDSRNLASLFSHRKRTIDETQATFQTAPSPTKDPYGRPDFFYEIKRRPRPENAPSNFTEERRQPRAVTSNSVGLQTGTSNIFDVSGCLGDKEYYVEPLLLLQRLLDAAWMLCDGEAPVDFWNSNSLRTLMGSSTTHIRLRDCAFD